MERVIEEQEEIIKKATSKKVTNPPQPPKGKNNTILELQLCLYRERPINCNYKIIRYVDCAFPVPLIIQKANTLLYIER